MEIKEKRVLSNDGVHELYGKIYVPDGEIKGIYQVVHGMTEYIGRYDAFMRTIAENGYITFGHDHIGHGETAKADGEYGYFAHEDGWEILVDDVNVFASAVKEEYGASLPFILMGHSMGSFIARLAAEKFDFADKLIIMGTGYVGAGLAGAGLATINLIKKTKGEKVKSPTIDKLLFGAYNDRFKDENDVYAWLSKDISVRDRYRNDPLCTFKFTASAYADLVKLNRNCCLQSWFDNVAKKQPILLVSGSEDPVGAYGASIKTIYDKLKKAGADVECILYENCRHEILNDDCRERVIADILEFIGK